MFPFFFFYSRATNLHNLPVRVTMTTAVFLLQKTRLQKVVTLRPHKLFHKGSYFLLNAEYNFYRRQQEVCIRCDRPHSQVSL